MKIYNKIVETHGRAMAMAAMAVAVELSKTLGFPLLVRPSYVLGGQSMKIVINETELEQHSVSNSSDK